MVKEQAREQMGKQAGAGEAGIMYRRIGNTLFKVRVFTSETERETAGEKIMRLIKKEAVQIGSSCGKMELPQMSQPPERSST